VRHLELFHPLITPQPSEPLNQSAKEHSQHTAELTFSSQRHDITSLFLQKLIMVRLSQAASVLLLALGASAFVPAKLGNVGVRSSVTNSPANNQIESCDAVLSRMDGKVRELTLHLSFVYIVCTVCI
jgi:hypothetical protein